jgi:hypothetical protein
MDYVKSDLENIKSRLGRSTRRSKETKVSIRASLFL